jgi:hypothetical protein
VLVGVLGGGLVGEIVCGSLGLLDVWMVPLPCAETATPAYTYRIDRQASIVTGLGCGPILGLLCVAVLPLLGGGLKSTIVVGIVGGLLFGLVASLAVTSIFKIIFAELILAVTGTGRVNFMLLLEDARDRQVLRQVGTAYQFRHAELQDYLVKIHRRRTSFPPLSASGGPNAPVTPNAPKSG